MDSLSQIRLWKACIVRSLLQPHSSHYPTAMYPPARCHSLRISSQPEKTLSHISLLLYLSLPSLTYHLLPESLFILTSIFSTYHLNPYSTYPLQCDCFIYFLFQLKTANRVPLLQKKKKKKKIKTTNHTYKCLSASTYQPHSCSLNIHPRFNHAGFSALSSNSHMYNLTDWTAIFSLVLFPAWPRSCHTWSPPRRLAQSFQ